MPKHELWTHDTIVTYNTEPEVVKLETDSSSSEEEDEDEPDELPDYGVDLGNAESV